MITLHQQCITLTFHGLFMSTVNLTDDIETLYVAVCDLNGNFRGKRIPHSKLESALAGSIRMPTSITSVDIW